MFGKPLGSVLLTAVVFFGAVVADDCGSEPDPPAPACTTGEQRRAVSPEGVNGFEACVNGQWVFYPAQ